MVERGWSNNPEPMKHVYWAVDLSTDCEDVMPEEAVSLALGLHGLTEVHPGRSR